MSQFPHLSENAAGRMALSNRDRIHHIKKPRWIGYGRATELLEKLEDFLVHPKQPRMPNMLLVGETNNGKTNLINKFRERHPARDNPSSEFMDIPVLYIQAPPSPDERELYSAILTRLFEAQRKNDPTDAKRDQVLQVLKKVNLGMIVVDEIHHLIAGSVVKQNACLNVLKYLGNELSVPIVGIGTLEALRAIQNDPQLANRFTPEVLPKWTKNPELARLLASFERVLPLREHSQLASQELAGRILDLAGGTIGEISTLLNAAAIEAINSGSERITIKELHACRYMSPFARKGVAAVV